MALNTQGYNINGQKLAELEAAQNAYQGAQNTQSRLTASKVFDTFKASSGYSTADMNKILGFNLYNVAPSTPTGANAPFTPLASANPSPFVTAEWNKNATPLAPSAPPTPLGEKNLNISPFVAAEFDKNAIPATPTNVAPPTNGNPPIDGGGSQYNTAFNAISAIKSAGSGAAAENARANAEQVAKSMGMTFDQMVQMTGLGVDNVATINVAPKPAIPTNNTGNTDTSNTGNPNVTNTDNTTNTGNSNVVNTGTNTGNTNGNATLTDNTTVNTATPTIQSSIDGLAAAQKASAIAGLDKAKASALSSLDAREGKIKPEFYDKRRQEGIASDNNKRIFADWLATKGLSSSGVSAQGEINRLSGLQSNIGSLKRQELGAITDIARDRSGVESDYAFDKANAEAGVESQRLQNNIDEMRRLDDKSFAREQFDWTKEQARIDNDFRTNQFDWQREQTTLDRAWQQGAFDYQKARDMVSDDRYKAEWQQKVDEWAFTKAQQSWENEFNTGKFDYQKAQDVLQQQNFDKEWKQKLAEWTYTKESQDWEKKFQWKQFDYKKAQDKLQQSNYSKELKLKLDQFAFEKQQTAIEASFREKQATLDNQLRSRQISQQAYEASVSAGLRQQEIDLNTLESERANTMQQINASKEDYTNYINNMFVSTTSQYDFSGKKIGETTTVKKDEIQDYLVSLLKSKVVDKEIVNSLAAKYGVKYDETR